MKYAWLAIEREYGSGGNEVGEKVSELLGIPCYGREILDMAAQRTNRRPEDIEHLEEKVTGSFMYSLFLMTQVNTGREERLTEADKLTLAEDDIVRELYRKEPCVFVGRGAAGVLYNEPKVLKVFIHADKDTRAKRAVEKYGDDRNTVIKKLEKMDKRRENFYHINSEKKWKDEDNYHMVLDSGKLGIETCAKIIAEIMKQP